MNCGKRISRQNSCSKTINTPPESGKYAKRSLMGWLGDIFKRSAKSYEARGDTYAKQNEWVHAKLEYESALDRQKGDSFVNSYQIEQLQKKIRFATEKLVTNHLENAKMLIEKFRFDDALELLKLTLILTEDENARGDAQKLIAEAIENRSSENVDGESVGSTEPETDDIYFTALIESLPEPWQEIYRGYGDNFRRGYLALNHGEFETAAKELAHAMQQNSPEGYIPFELASALVNLERTEEARLLLERFITNIPDFYPAYRMLSEIYWDKGEYELTDSLLANAPMELNDSEEMCILRGESKLQAGELSEAETTFLDIIECNGWDRYIAFQLSDVYQAMNKPHLASRIYKDIMADYVECGEIIPVEVEREFADLSFAAGEHAPTLLQLYLSLAKNDPDNAEHCYEKISQIYTTWDDEESALKFHLMAQK